MANEKSEGPRKAITFLGIELDTIQQSSRLPEVKLVNLRTQIRVLLQKKKVTLRELQEVVGHLNFACKVISPGRAFLRRLCDAMSGLKKPHHGHRLLSGMKDDLRTWLKLLMAFHFGEMTCT